MDLWTKIRAHIGRETGLTVAPASPRPLSGGCINRAYRLDRWFVKVNDTAPPAMFEAEAAGLQEIARTASVRVPQPVCFGPAYLVMEYVELRDGDTRAEERLGRELAAMHRATRSRFGWDRDNTIGSTPQINAECGDWAEFWRRHRLGFQLELARGNGAPRELLSAGERLLDRLPAFFADYRPRPSLLHGDLWGGNWAAAPQGAPVIFDPAVYYGDRETDLAMTELFGGFGPRFHAAYREAWPLDPGYAQRRHLYNLYHALNHYNLFGGGYARQAEGLMQRLLIGV